MDLAYCPTHRSRAPPSPAIQLGTGAAPQTSANAKPGPSPPPPPFPTLFITVPVGAWFLRRGWGGLASLDQVGMKYAPLESLPFLLS